MEKYTIKAGEHYSTNSLGLLTRWIVGWHFGRSLKMKVQFDPSCLHGNDDPLDAQDELKDRHKVFGMSDGLDHHYKSGRFGWVEDNGLIKLYTYVYDKGVRLKDKPIISLPAGWAYVLTITRGTSYWRFTVETEAGAIIGSQIVFTSSYRGWGVFMQLYPYYGGDYPAKIDTHIYMKKL